MKNCFFIVLFIALSNQIQAQYFDKTYGVSWDINMPISNTVYVDQISARGFKFGYREMINEKFFGGFDISNTTFIKHKPRNTYTNGSNAITTDLFNYAYSYGLTLSFDYLLKTEQKFMPYVSLGVGASYISYRQFFNAYSNDDDNWGVLVRPQVGALYKLKDDSKWAFQAALHYDYSSAKSENLGLDALSSLGLQMGIIILDW